MQSINFWPSFFFTGALLLAVSFLTGCDSSSSPSVTATEDPPKVDAAPDTQTSEPAEKNLLTLGSIAPPLDIEHWLSDGHGKFGEVTNFESGKVYVVEFWATWCGPCIASMPHLAELQESFADQDVQIISVSSEDLDTVKKMLPRKYKSSSDDGPSTYGELTSAYCLTTDPDRSVSNDYMKAAGRNGIPCAFIVGKSGLIEWIGHPNGMDKPLQQVVIDKWDREQSAAAMKKAETFKKLALEVLKLSRQGKTDEAKRKLAEEKANLDEEFSPAIEQLEAQVAFAAVKKMIEADQIDDAMAEIQQQRETGNEKFAPVWDQKLVNLLVKENRYKEAADKVNGLLNDTPPELLNQLAWGIYEHASKDNEIPAELLDAAIAATEKALEETPNNGAILDTLAHLLHLSGDLDRAIEVQNKAMENPGSAEADIEAFLEQLLKEKEDNDAS